MENIMESYVSGYASSYATGPLLVSISKGPQNLGANLPHLPNLNELCFDFTFKYTWSPI